MQRRRRGSSASLAGVSLPKGFSRGRKMAQRTDKVQKGRPCRPLVYSSAA
ncbi:hypothetical protein J8Z82_09905 [Yersinia enterocolitica]|nr:hypothetical protein [Yersinia enterocolitica]MBX9489528.1 hypothetical protein [Yersinia enterocolitica]MBX9492104.1 hypothetical protein [Yersinia enterocolitica]